MSAPQAVMEGPRHAQITATDHGPAVNVASWIMMTICILFTIFRMISNFVLRGSVSGDDAIIALATITAIAQTVATSFSVHYGLGRHQDTLSGHELEGFLKSMMASQILYVASLALSKFSLLFLLMRLISSPQKAYRLLLRASWALMLGYFVAEIFALALQCDLPNTWDITNGQCINIGAFWDFDAAFDIAAALMILVLPCMIIWPLQMSTSRKIGALSPFYFQIAACAFAILRLVYIHKSLGSKDHTWSAATFVIWTSVNVHFNVVIANLPCVKIFLDGFNSTVLSTSTNLTGRNTQMDYSSNSRNSRVIASRFPSKGFSKLNEHQSIGKEDPYAYDSRADKPTTTVTVSARPDSNSIEEVSLNDDSGISKTTEWHIGTERLIERQPNQYR